jgi:hypothetical protein
LPEAPPTESSASTSGTPAANMVDSVRVQRAMRIFDQVAEDGQLQQQAVHEHLHLLVALPGLHEEVEAAAHHAEDQPPVLHEEVADGDHQQRGRGQVGAEGVNTSLKAGITKIMITETTTKATTITEIGYISADLILDLMASVFSM